MKFIVALTSLFLIFSPTITVSLLHAGYDVELIEGPIHDSDGYNNGSDLYAQNNTTYPMRVRIVVDELTNMHNGLTTGNIIVEGDKKVYLGRLQQINSAEAWSWKAHLEGEWECDPSREINHPSCQGKAP